MYLRNQHRQRQGQEHSPSLCFLTFMVFALIFSWVFDPFWALFLDDLRDMSKSTLFHVGIYLSQHHLLKRLSCHPCQKSVGCECDKLFRGFQCYSTDLWVLFSIIVLYTPLSPPSPSSLPPLSVYVYECFAYVGCACRYLPTCGGLMSILGLSQS